MSRIISEAPGAGCPDCESHRVIRRQGKGYCLDCGAEWTIAMAAPKAKRRPGRALVWGEAV